VTERTFGSAELFGRTSTVRFGPNDRTFFCRTPNFSFKFLFCLMNIICLHLQPPWLWRGSFLQPGTYLVMKEILCYMQTLRNYFFSEKIFQKKNSRLENELILKYLFLQSLYKKIKFAKTYILSHWLKIVCLLDLWFRSRFLSAFQMFGSVRFRFGKLNFNWLVQFGSGRTLKHWFGRSLLQGSVRPKPLFWFRSDTETETQIGRYFRPIPKPIPKLNFKGRI